MITHFAFDQKEYDLKHFLDLIDLNFVGVQVHQHHHVVAVDAGEHLGLLLAVQFCFIALVLSILKSQMFQNMKQLLDLFVQVNVTEAL